MPALTWARLAFWPSTITTQTSRLYLSVLPQLPDLAHLLSATTLDHDSVGMLRDGTEALVGVLAMVTGAGGVDIDEPVQ
jgi:hypothetical protein